MAVTKQELIEFLRDITSTVSISVKENIEKKIRLLANEFVTKFSCKLKEVDKSSQNYIRELPKERQVI